jgi:hypothetical protein
VGRLLPVYLASVTFHLRFNRPPPAVHGLREFPFSLLRHVPSCVSFLFSFLLPGPNFLMRLLLGSYDYLSAAERPLLFLSSPFSSVAGFPFQVLISAFPSGSSPFGLPLCHVLLDLFCFRNLFGHGCCCRSWGRSPGSCTAAFTPAKLLAASSSS